MAFHGFVEELKYEEIDFDVIREKHFRCPEGALSNKDILTIVRDVAFSDYWMEDLAEHFSTCENDYRLYCHEFEKLCPVILSVILENITRDENLVNIFQGQLYIN